jgi:RNA polymerase sigma-70 factor (ECF subfamily)
MLHDVFMVVHRRLDEYDGRAAMTTWLYNVARGVVSNDRRGRTREARRVQLVQPEPAPAPDPEEALGRSEAARFVEGFLAGLDAPKREMFELVDVDGLTVPAAARICNTNLNTAYSRLRAARNEFQQAVGRRAPHPSRRVSG